MELPTPFLAGAFFVAFSGFALAQAPAPAAAPAAPSAIANAPALVSPEVLADRRVTFRLSAPKATTVTMKGDWHDEVKALTKDDKGVWSLTLGPFAPSNYIYNFTMDGVVIADPANPQVKLRQQGQGSFFNVPGDASGLGDVRAVPHGSIEVDAQKSVVLSEARAFLVYTPPGYAQERDRRYPVLYLLPGSNDRPQVWVDIGKINSIADNLIAEKKAEPMIIVMTMVGSRGNGVRDNAAVFEEYLLKHLIPAVEAKYRVAAGRQNRAIAGLSMGGDTSMRVFSNRVEKFSAAGMFSPAPSVSSVPAEKPAVYGDAKAFNAQVDALFLACGRQDSFFARSKELDESLTALGINHTWWPTEGDHHTALWREQAAEFLPLLFHAGGPAARAAGGK